jgi:hypothetical protein
MDSTVIALSCATPGVNIHYTLDGSEPTRKSTVYQRPVTLRKTVTVKVIAMNAGLQKSLPIEATFTKIPKNRRITLNSAYAGQYAAGGDLALIDFIKGGDNFHTGGWQGYEGVDLEAVVDLGAAQPLKKLSLGCLQNQGSWIFMPVEVSWWLSEDGSNFTSVSTIPNDVDEHHNGAITKEFSASLKGTKGRYVKVIAKNRGVCPSWHLGAGGKAWIFADEISIE